MNNEITQIKEHLNAISFKGLECIQCGDMIHYPLTHLYNQEYTKRFVSQLKAVAKLFIKLAERIFYDYYAFDECGSGGVLFVYSDAYGYRTDLFENFKSVSKLCEGCVTIFPQKKRHFSFSKLKSMKYAFQWNKQLRKCVRDSALRNNILFQLLTVYSEYLECMSFIQDKKVALLVSFCDVHPLESLLTQAFHQKTIKTATLQHGVYSSVVNNWVFVGSRSDYILGYGQFTQDEGILSGVDRNKIKKIGAMSLIGQSDRKEKEFYRAENIGLILDGEDGSGLHELNRRMICFAQDYCLKRKKRLLIKFHPASDPNQYKHYLKDDVAIDFFWKETQLTKFFDLIDIAIIRNTTCLIESLQCWIPTFIYYEREQSFNVYKNVALCKFSSAEELDDYIENINTEQVRKMIADLRVYFCEEGDPANRFREAFQQLKTQCVSLKT